MARFLRGHKVKSKAGLPRRFAPRNDTGLDFVSFHIGRLLGLVGLCNQLRPLCKGLKK